MKKATWIVLVLLVSGTAIWSAQSGFRKASTYVDGVYGFTMKAPSFPMAARGGSVMPVMLLGPAENGFSSNVNVMVQRKATTREAYREFSLQQFQGAGFTVNSEKQLTVSGKDALLLDYEGKQGGRALRWLALAVIDTDRILLVTCTAPKDGFAKYEKTFQACLSSFQLR